MGTHLFVAWTDDPSVVGEFRDLYEKHKQPEFGISFQGQYEIGAYAEHRSPTVKKFYQEREALFKKHGVDVNDIKGAVSGEYVNVLLAYPGNLPAIRSTRVRNWCLPKLSHEERKKVEMQLNDSPARFVFMDTSEERDKR